MVFRPGAGPVAAGDSTWVALAADSPLHSFGSHIPDHRGAASTSGARPDALQVPPRLAAAPGGAIRAGDARSEHHVRHRSKSAAPGSAIETTTSLLEELLARDRAAYRCRSPGAATRRDCVRPAGQPQLGVDRERVGLVSRS